MNKPDPYEQTCIEIRQGHIAHHIWARAACEADGNQQETQRLYLKYRSEEISRSAPQGWQPGDPCRRRTQSPSPYTHKLSQYRKVGAQPKGKLLSVLV